MYNDLISKEEFLFRTKHADANYIKLLAEKVREIMLVNINLEQSRENLIKTLYSLFYKVRGELPEDALLEHDSINYFSYDAHFSCPFDDNSDLKRYYMKLVDHFGFNKKITRIAARDLLQEYAKQMNYTFNAKTLVYRIFSRIQAKHGMFVKFYSDKKHVMLYPVIRWTDSNKPIFEEI